ncbi:MAG: lamin tail domain-containing protein [Candidatus Cloacimonetes bacterium]|nr:lamin tail domain-containing protein [Candidatus Cloacimonadota bacterium]
MKNVFAFLLLAAVMLPLHADLFFSEYIEGSSNNKALEICNSGAVAVDLADYAIWRISNGGDWTEGQSNAVQLVGTVPAEGVWVICNSSADPAIQAVSDSIGSTATYYNGNDAMGLAYFDGSDWTLIDAIGEADPNPPAAWDVAGVSGATGEHTLVRKSGILTGTTDWAASAGANATNSQWLVYPQDTFSYLGSHDLVGGNVPPAISNVIYTPGFPTPTDAVEVSADVIDAARSVASVVLDWGTDGTTYPNNIGMSLGAGDNYVTDSDIPAQAEGTTVYFRITATDDESDTSEYSDNYTVTTVSVVTIYDIQGQVDASPYDGQIVTTNGIVTAVASGSYFIQDGAGEWNGIYVYDGAHTVVQGDDITITALVQEYYDLTELTSVGSTTVNSAGNPLPTAAVVATGAMLEPYEGVLTQVIDATCIVLPNTYGEWQVNDGTGAAIVDDVIYAYSPTLSYTYSITGPVTYGYGAYKLLPRDAADVIESGGDLTPPEVTCVTVADAATVVVNFNEELDADTAQDIFNYSISVRVGITAAVLDGVDPTIVTLTVTDLNYGDYTLEVNDVEDTSGNACENETFNFSYLAASDIVITEVMQNPDAVGDNDGEYFEVYNNGGTAIDMNGWIISDLGSNLDTLTCSGDTLVVQPGQYFVLGRNADTGTNGGVPVDYQYGSFYLGNSDDEIVLSMADGTEVDRVEWDGGAVWPDPTGASMMFMGAWTQDNNDGTLWQTATTAWTGSAGDFGTPGESNSGGLDAPANLLITMSGTDAVLNWDAVAGATIYHIYRGTSPDSLTFLIDEAGLTYTDVGAGGTETRYFYYVTAE